MPMTSRRLSIWCAFLGALTLGCNPPRTGTIPPSTVDPRLVAEGRFVLYAAPDSGQPGDAPESTFVLPVTIRGKSFQLLVDHGSNSTVLTDSTVEAIHVPHWYANATRVDTAVRGPGFEPVRDTTASVRITRGDSVFQYWGDFEPLILDSMRIGRSLQDQVFISLESSAGLLNSFGGLIGRDMLSQFDLEFDFQTGVLRLYMRSVAPTQKQRHLPKGMTAASCVAANVLRHNSMDTTQMDSSDRRELLTNPAKRMWEQEELQLPLTANGHRIDALFDSGSRRTIMNWAAAHALGIARTDSALRLESRGRQTLFLFNQRPTAASDSLAVAQDTEPNFSASGVSLRIGPRALPRDSILISDLTFADFSEFRTKPLILVGLRHFRDSILFLSYSTQEVCVGGPR